jgi:hypothetical protein
MPTWSLVCRLGALSAESSAIEHEYASAFFKRVTDYAMAKGVSWFFPDHFRNDAAESNPGVTDRVFQSYAGVRFRRFD